MSGLPAPFSTVWMMMSSGTASSAPAVPHTQLQKLSEIRIMIGLIVRRWPTTSGVTTYAANRSVTVTAPDAEGRTVIDFTRATNLPCAYTDFATCPLPPAENRLPFAVEAGEKTPLSRAEGVATDAGIQAARS